MAWHLQHHSLNPEVRGHHPHPPGHPPASPVGGAPFSMNLHMAPPSPGPGGCPLLLERKCCRLLVRAPPLARSARAPGRPQPTPLCFCRPTAVSTRAPCGPPAPSPAGLWPHAEDGTRLQTVTALHGQPRVLQEHSESALWGHDPGQDPCPEKLDPPRPRSTRGLGKWAWQGRCRP